MDTVASERSVKTGETVTLSVEVRGLRANLWKRDVYTTITKRMPSDSGLRKWTWEAECTECYSSFCSRLPSSSGSSGRESM